MFMPKMSAARASASLGVFASLMPPALPRPPTSTWLFTTTGPPSRTAISRASAGVDATSPLGMGMPALAKMRFDWYSCKFKVDPPWRHNGTHDGTPMRRMDTCVADGERSEEHTSELQSRPHLV